MTKTADPFRKSEENARQYDEFARTMSARVYPVIADQILERTGITTGTCLDVGSGPALLGISLALLSELHVTALDHSPAMCAQAQRNIRNRCMEELVFPLIGDVHAIPAPDATFRLVVSRGSYPSREDLPAAFLEIYRVLRPGGMAYLGGGYGNARLREEVYARRRLHDIPDNPAYSPKTRFCKFSVGEFEAAMEVTGIADFRIIDDDSGFWILFRKNEGKNRADPAP